MNHYLIATLDLNIAGMGNDLIIITIPAPSLSELHLQRAESCHPRVRIYSPWSCSWAVSPAELREALDALGGGDGATPRFSMSEMHDASEVLGEIFTCLHRCRRGLARACVIAQRHEDVPSMPLHLTIHSNQPRPSLPWLAAPQRESLQPPAQGHGDSRTTIACSSRAPAARTQTRRPDADVLVAVRAELGGKALKVDPQLPQRVRVAPHNGAAAPAAAPPTGGRMTNGIDR